ncbi:MAG: hypothetical protein UY90_C0051G0002 [Candidatus Peregrinibacteria bacterium GW2011_GWA2_54_9]|nr:MAG: hypothetical protein UY90_C0051G0002 [Candidatus Peregrinibacteria bacterium GW2011_GWA2_54_9]
MSATATQPEAMPDRQETAEVQPFIPTPERLSQLLEMDIGEVRRMYQSATERGQLVDQIMAEQETLSEHHSNIYRDEMEELIRVGSEQLAKNPDVSLFELEETLHEVQQSLAAKRDFLTETSPEGLSQGEAKEQVLERVEQSEEQAGTEKEKGLWHKAWRAITWLPREHPVIFSILLIAAAAWGLSELFEYLGGAQVELAGEADALVRETSGAAEAVTPVTGLTEPGSAITAPGTGPVSPSGVTGYGDTMLPSTHPSLPSDIPGTR